MYENYSTVGSILTGAISMVYIREILGIIILVLSIANILINAGVKVYHKIKNKKYGEIPNDINNTIEQLKNIKEDNEDV